MVEKTNLTNIIQGDTKRYKFTFDDGKVSPTAINITGWTIWISFKSDIELPDGLAELLIETTAGDEATDDPINGIMTLTIPSTLSAAVPDGKYEYSIQRVFDDSGVPDVKTLMYGKVKIIKDVLTSTSIDLIVDQFTFSDLTSVAVSTETTSNIILINGINFPVSVTLTGDASSEYSINNGEWNNAVGIAKQGDSIKIRHTSSSSNSTQVDSILTIGTIVDTFSSTTI